MTDRRRLVLWDIDGTILRGGGLWSECFIDAYREVLEIPPDDDRNGWRRVSFSGKTDRLICRELMEATGHWRVGVEPGSCAEHESRIDAVLRGYLDRVKRRIPARAGEIRVLPGVVELLKRLGERPEVTLGLLTGNVREGAWLKLESVGLRAPFKDFGAFGCDHWDRYELPRIAVSRARDQLGIEFAGKQVVIIGDTIHDVGCGQSIGVRAIAVGTGQRDARERVRSAWLGDPQVQGDPKADHYYEDLGAVDDVMNAILI